MAIHLDKKEEVESTSERPENERNHLYPYDGQTIAY